MTFHLTGSPIAAHNAGVPYATVNGIRLFYEERGRRDGPPLLLHPGLTGHHRFWGGVAQRLDRSYRLILLDPRDAGKSGRAQAPYTIADMASDVVGLLEHLGLEGVHLAGTSMGGAVAQEVAIRYPSRVRRLVLIATYDAGDPRGTFAFRHMARLRRLLSREDYAGTLVPWSYTYEELTFGGLTPEQIVRETIDDPYFQEPEAYERQMEATIAFQSRDRLDRITAPTLLVFGEDDLYTPVRFARSMHERIRESRLVVLSGAGHALLRTRGPEVAALIDGFLKETP